MFFAINTLKRDKRIMAISAKAPKDSDRKQSFERLELVPKVATSQCGNLRIFLLKSPTKNLRETNFAHSGFSFL